MKNKTYKYKNGATLLYTHSNNCNATAMRVGFLVGHKDNKIGGEAHFLEHALLSRTKNYSKDELRELRNKYGIYNASTSGRSTLLHIKKSNRYIEKTFELAKEILLNPGFTQKDVDDDKKIITEEYNLKKPSTVGSSQLAFEKNCTTPYLTIEMELGDPKTIEKYTAKQLYSFMKKHYVASNFIVSVASSLSFSKVKKLVDKYFIPYLSLKENKSAKFDYQHTPVNKLEFIKRKDDDNENTKVCIYIFFKKEYKQLYESYDFDFILSHLNRHPSSSIYMSLRNAGLVYESDVTAESTENQTYLQISFTTRQEKFNEAISEVNKCILENLAKGFEGEVENFKQQKETTLDEDEYYPSLSDICSTSLSQHDSMYTSLPLEKRLKFLKNLSNESATKLFKEVFNKENPVFITIKSNKSRKDFPTYAQLRKDLFKGL